MSACGVCGKRFDSDAALNGHRGGAVHCWRPKVVRPAISKDDASCCRSRALADGRPVIGYCSPTCERRPVVVP